MEREYNVKDVGMCVLLLVFLFLNACATIKTDPNITVISASEKKIPVRAGYYVNPYLCKWIAVPLGDTKGTRVGETLCNGIDSLMQAAFVGAIKLPSLDKLESENVQLIIIPEIIESSDISIYRPYWSLSGKCNSVVKLKWLVQDKEKNILFVQTITGKAEGYGPFDFRPILYKGIQDHFQKVLETFMALNWDQMLEDQSK